MILIFDSIRTEKSTAATRGACGKVLRYYQPLCLTLLGARQCARQIKRLEPSNFVYSVISGVALAEIPSFGLLLVRMTPNVLRLWMWWWADHSGSIRTKKGQRDEWFDGYETRTAHRRTFGHRLVDLDPAFDLQAFARLARGTTFKHSC